ncbi:hypothetical protein BH11ARM2_BH11ARM2_31670 [soil metagenome]
MLNLDTHILIAFVEGTLKPAERALLEESSWAISAMVLWELHKLVQKGRIVYSPDHPQMADLLKNITILPLDRAVARASVNLDFNSDPADEIIAATSIVHRIPLVTRDARIRASRKVPLAL